jgi:hypothetical protein
MPAKTQQSSGQGPNSGAGSAPGNPHMTRGAKKRRGAKNQGDQRPIQTSQNQTTNNQNGSRSQTNGRSIVQNGTADNLSITIDNVATNSNERVVRNVPVATRGRRGRPVGSGSTRQSRQPVTQTDNGGQDGGQADQDDGPDHNQNKPSERAYQIRDEFDHMITKRRQNLITDSQLTSWIAQLMMELATEPNSGEISKYIHEQLNTIADNEMRRVTNKANGRKAPPSQTWRTTSNNSDSNSSNGRPTTQNVTQKTSNNSNSQQTSGERVSPIQNDIVHENGDGYIDESECNFSACSDGGISNRQQSNSITSLPFDMNSEEHMRRLGNAIGIGLQAHQKHKKLIIPSEIVKFDGCIGKIQAMEWLHQLKLFRQTETMQDKEFINNIGACFKHNSKAYTWYYTEGRLIKTWEEFTLEFINTYGFSENERSERKQELKKIVQQNDQSFASYCGEFIIAQQALGLEFTDKKLLYWVYTNMHPEMKLKIDFNSITNLKQLRQRVNEKERLQVESCLVKNGYSLAEWGHIQTMEQYKQFVDGVKESKTPQPNVTKQYADQMMQAVSNLRLSEPKQAEMRQIDTSRQHSQNNNKTKPKECCDHGKPQPYGNFPKQGGQPSKPAPIKSEPDKPQEVGEKRPQGGGGFKKRGKRKFDNRSHKPIEEREPKAATNSWWQKRKVDLPYGMNKDTNITGCKEVLEDMQNYNEKIFCRLCLRRGFKEFRCKYCFTEEEIKTMFENYKTFAASKRQKTEEEPTPSTSGTQVHNPNKTDQKRNQGNGPWGGQSKSTI